MSRECLYQDARQIDTSKYTHLHFAFGMLSADYQVSTGNALSTYEFESFKRLGGVHRVLSFGGWAFSTEAITNIFRSGVDRGQPPYHGHQYCQLYQGERPGWGGY